MKIIHVPFCFHPDPAGGTEVYVESLARNLGTQGVDVIVAAPGEGDAAYTHAGLPVRRFAVSPATDLRELYGEGDVVAADGFARILDEEQTDIVHLHAFTSAVSLRLVRATKQRDLPIIFTYHTPTASCQRGTLMRWGTEVCDGVLDLHTCARCTLHSLGMGKASSLAVGSLPPRVGRLLGHAGLSGGTWTALRMTELVELRHAAFRALMDEVDHVVALCQWVKDLLLRNGVPAGKITVSRHGLPQSSGTAKPRKVENNRQDATHGTRNTQHATRIAFLGRLHPTKGPDVLIRAVRSLPEAPITLHLFGIVQDEGVDGYVQQLRDLAGSDPRIELRPPVPSDQVIPLLRSYDLLAVPSRWLETGPLVVLEAFAAGIPVIGSSLGGIAELVEHEVDGLLVEPDSVEAWSQVFLRVCEDPNLLTRLQEGVRPPRKVGGVAEEMLYLYERYIERPGSDAPLAYTPSS